MKAQIEKKWDSFLVSISISLFMSYHAYKILFKIWQDEIQAGIFTLILFIIVQRISSISTKSKKLWSGFVVFLVLFVELLLPVFGAFDEYRSSITIDQKKIIIAKHLIKSVTPPQNEKEKKYLYDMVPMLIHRLQEGFESVCYNPFDANQLMSELESVQMEVLRGQVPQHVDATPEEGDAVDNLLDAISKDIRLQSETH